MDSTTPWYAKYTYALAALILTIYVMIVARPLLLPLLFAIFFAIMLTPLCDWLEKFKIPRILSVLMAILTGFLVLAGLGFLFYIQVTEFVKEADLIEQRLTNLFADIEGFLVSWFGVADMIQFEAIDETIFAYIRENATDLTRRLAGAASILTATFLVPVFVFLILLSRDFLNEFILQSFGRHSDEDLHRTRKIFQRIKAVIHHYIFGILIVIAILAVLNTTILMIIGIDHAIFFGVFAALLNVIPFIGPIIGSFLPIIYSLVMMDSLIIPVVILASFYIIQLFESNLFTPMIVGSQVSMNALATLLLLFTGAQIWGLAGMILFIPLGAILKVVFDEVESLKPLGFLLGSVPPDLQSQKGPLARRIGKLSKKE